MYRLVKQSTRSRCAEPIFISIGKSTEIEWMQATHFGSEYCAQSTGIIVAEYFERLVMKKKNHQIRSK